MKKVLLVSAFMSLAFVIAAPAFSAEDKDVIPATEGPSVEAEAGDVTEVTATCPNCGEKITVGRHGQEALTVKCPKCGKEVEVCKEEAEAGLCYGSDVAFFNKYVVRGLVTTDDPVFQSDVWLSYKGFTASVWGNMDLTDINTFGGDFNELDFTLDYSGSLDKLSYSSGLVYYKYPNTDFKDSAEVYAGVGYDLIIKPKLVVYYDFWQGDGFYGVFSLSHGFELPKVWEPVDASLDISAQVGLGSKNMNVYNFGCDHTAFDDLVFTASLPVAVSGYVTFKPTVSYSTVLDGAIRTKNGPNDNIVFGGVVSASF